ncbi:30S ribosomal protein S20 [Halanaerobiaceae bacterium Z-7014]|uniref:Small ribosomal subunit protein bS20 n=1 Tax=Halonatronomonas betaini TaxID=2778430 RepID=A0A931F934_9FIRM|nr:30S ribosomal protein S20 [Halonatronomonas betaini]MBF8436004.1 30S ribosomal protein S20 [Halonatronomonas betaini]
MPIIESAKKRVRTSAKKAEQNKKWKKAMKLAIKDYKKLIEGDPSQEEAKESLAYAYKMIDKAVKNNIIHENNAARKKSRLTRMLNEKFN